MSRFIFAVEGRRDGELMDDRGPADFARKDYTGAPLKKLVDIINYVKPTALIGLSTVRVSLPFYLPARLLACVRALTGG